MNRETKTGRRERESERKKGEKEIIQGGKTDER